ncbi:metallophosphoesterase [Halorussus gelatinilyticus]|uniref:Phosphoesterase n=1 Tax=Halorussus gelatinilyticus TaxID=2937524 RepID=A0A8U0IMK6_9EURY|nr:metallophosphoesterase [Halorussus gelatinilyticus]UPW01662.1 metallophosphoesterase [Halorussus gelatinilyticus]
MITVLSDTHSRSGNELEGRAKRAVEESDAVVHAGDFVNAAALDAFEAVADRLYAVYGNNATPEVRDRLPPERTFEIEGVRFVLTHGDDRGATGLSLLGRQQAADAVVFGHSHRHAATDAEDVLLLNPGSHADPRGGTPTHAELRVADGEERTDARLVGEIRHRDGSVVETFEIE